MPVLYPFQPSTVVGHCGSSKKCEPVCPAPKNVCIETCDNRGRDVETTCVSDMVPYVVSGLTYKEGTERVAAPENAILDALKLTLTDFTAKTRILERRAKLTTQKGLLDYYIEPLNGERIHLIRSVCVGGCCIQFTNGRCCDSSHSSDGGFTFEIPDKIVFDRASCVDGKTILVKYVASTANDACNVDKQIWERYKDAIILGAQERLLTLPGWEWTNPSYGMNAYKRYKMLRSEAAIQSWRGHLIGGAGSAFVARRF